MIKMKFLIAARNVLGFDQDEVAKSLGVARETISRIERGMIKSEKIRMRMMGEYQDAGAHFILPDDSEIPDGEGFIIKSEKKT